MSDLVISVHTSDQKVRKFATKEPKLLKKLHWLEKGTLPPVFLHTQCFQLGFTRIADRLMTTTVYRSVVRHNVWVTLLFCFENILNLSSLSY